MRECERLLNKQNTKVISQVEKIKPDKSSNESESLNTLELSNEVEIIENISIVSIPEKKENEEEADFLGAGFGDYEKNKIVEEAAIDFVRKQYDGWDIKSVERDKVGYDLICTNNSLVENVEVKGVSRNEPAFIITANEVNQANENPKFVLWVVTSALNSPKGQRWIGSEMLSQFELKPIQYMARLRPNNQS